VALDAVVIPSRNVPPELCCIHAVSGLPSPSTSIVSRLAAPAGTPVPSAAHPGDGRAEPPAPLPGLPFPGVVRTGPLVGGGEPVVELAGVPVVEVVGAGAELGGLPLHPAIMVTALSPVASVSMVFVVVRCPTTNFCSATATP